MTRELVFSSLRAFTIATLSLFAVLLDDTRNAQCQNQSIGARIKTVPSWIWASDSEAPAIFGRKNFEVEGDVKQAFLVASADNECDLFLNERKVLTSKDWGEVAMADVQKQIRSGKNSLTFSARNQGGPAGVYALLILLMKDGQMLEIASDSSWKLSKEARGDWKSSRFNDSDWEDAKVIGVLGAPGLPWSESNTRETLAASFGSSQQAEFTPEMATVAKAPEGFKIEKIFHVPRVMGSWVSLTEDDRGRLIASDQAGAGLFLITPGNDKQPTKVEKLPVALSGAQGLLWAFDSLYAVVNGGDKSGLHRLRDTDGDGKVDSDEFCMHVEGGGEHGPHAVILSPDKKSLFVASGNHTKLPKTIAGSKIPMNWNEDHLLPRRWDANGHAAGILAPGGWICQVDPSGKEWTVYSMGYRNQYDIAFNSDGDLFTYDADMEWDFGTPWYRPTRVCHATSGSEFGWRSGTGKWPVYYEDSLPPVVDIGPGSPTGVVFGTGAKFPEKYQQALYILDWTYSTIYAVHLAHDGSSYKGVKEDFVTGTPLQVTDAVVGSDGAFYFAAGGRGTQSDLYRVTYVGKESTEPARQRSEGAKDRELRRQLEASHGKPNADLNFLFTHLGSDDRFIRYAARVALESQPISDWKERAFAVQGNKAALNAMLAVAHQGQSKDLERIINRLMQIDMRTLPENEMLFWARVLEVAFARMGEPSDELRQKLVNVIDSQYPAKSYSANAELVQLLIFLRSPTVIDKTLRLMDQLGPEPIPDWGYLVSRHAGYGGTVGKMLSDMPPARAVHFAFMLRNVKEGWTLQQRQKYFQFFIDAAKKPGGNSYAKFLMQFRDDALAHCSPAELVVLDKLVSTSLLAAPFEATPPKGPGRKWSVNDALTALESKESKPNFEAGKNLYHATSCSKCHRLGGEGGAIGPDLSTAGRKFSPTDLMEAIIDPSKAISDQYGSHQVLTADGKTIEGRAVEIGDEVYVYTISPDAKPLVIKKNEIEAMKPSKVSQMPLGLIDTLNAGELRDLIAYINASGEKRSPIYR
jgi:putative heme-binding domain-containing protein